MWKTSAIQDRGNTRKAHVPKAPSIYGGSCRHKATEGGERGRGSWLCVASYRCIVHKRENPRGTQRKNFLLLLLHEPPPRLLTGGAFAKNLPPAGFFNAAGFSLYYALCMEFSERASRSPPHTPQYSSPSHPQYTHYTAHTTAPAPRTRPASCIRA